MVGEQLTFPSVFEGGRKAAFTALATIAAFEAAAHVAMSGGLRALLRTELAPALAGSWLGLAAVAAAGAYWARGVTAEWFGQKYVNAVRAVLARQTVRAAGANTRLGAVTVRMTSDLNALKEWADTGLCGAAAGGFGLCGAAAASWVAAGPAGLAAVALGPALAVVTTACLAGPLQRAVSARRQARGRLSAQTGDLVQAARSYGAYGAERRPARLVRRAGEKLGAASVRLARVRFLLHLPVLLTLPLGVAALATARTLGLESQTWAGVLFALSLGAGAVHTLVRAFEASVERNVAVRRIKQLLRLADSAPAAAPTGTLRLPPGGGVSLWVDGVELAPAGSVVRIGRDDAVPWLERVRRGEAGVQVDGIAATDVTATDWARRIAVCSPDQPLPRGRLARALAAKRPADQARLTRALAWIRLDPVLLPGTVVPEPSAQDARLRLVRALAHRPRLLIVNDPWLLADGALMPRLQRWCDGRGITLLIIE